jgi:hypothetical protein
MTTEESLVLSQTFRIPRGLWRDLEESIIHQDRQFLSEVARSLGLPVQDVLRKCLGTGAPQQVPVLWAPPKSTAPDICPWWEYHGDGLWRRCPRLRLNHTLPCQIHERCTPCPHARLDSDPLIKRLGWRKGVKYEGAVYWIDPDGIEPPLREDGTVETEGTFKEIAFRGEMIWVWSPRRTA